MRHLDYLKELDAKLIEEIKRLGKPDLPSEDEEK
jgi:hypothetical protein